MSYHSSNRYPNSSAFDASSRLSRGIDAIYLQWRVLAECQAQISPDSSNGDCDIWIGVFGFTNTTYSVTATAVNGQQRTMLLDGVPAAGIVSYKMYTYYYALVRVPYGRTYSLYLRSIAGDADMYVRLDGQTPSNTFYQFAATAGGGNDIINITPNSQYYNASCTMVSSSVCGAGASGGLTGAFRAAICHTSTHACPPLALRVWPGCRH